MDRERLERLRAAIPTVEIVLRTVDGGYEVVSGVMRLKAALSLQEEVVISAAGIGKMLVFKTPDGKINVTQDAHAVALFGI